MFNYILFMRPFSSFTCPTQGKDFTVDTTGPRHGTITYTEALTGDEVKAFELLPIKEMQAINGQVHYGTKGEGHAEYRYFYSDGIKTPWIKSICIDDEGEIVDERSLSFGEILNAIYPPQG